MKPALPKLLAIVGPTASGKTDLAVALAKKLKGEIISADSRQFYRGTEIGSDIIPGKWVKRYGRRTYVAKGVPHYLIGFHSPSKTFTAAQFKDHVIRISRDIAKRGHVPILAGGTGLYLKAVIDNLDIPEVPPDAAFRARMERKTTAALYAELKKKDPAYASRIPPNNRRYAIRALEVFHATGRPFSEVQGAGEPLFDVLQIGIRGPRCTPVSRRGWIH
jgi:tRNA dimethylallyltransferase